MEILRGKRTKISNINIELYSIFCTTIFLLSLSLTALFPPFVTILFSIAMAVVLCVGLPHIFNNPAKLNSTISLGIVTLVSVPLLLRDTGFLIIALCVAFGILVCFLNEIFRVQGRENLLYSISTNTLSMVSIIGAISWIIFTRLYSWHFYVMPLCISIMIAMIFVNLIRNIGGFRKRKFKSSIVGIIAFIVAFIISMIIVKIAYKSGFQIYVTSAVLLDSSNKLTLNYFISILYSLIIATISVGYAMIQKTIRIFGFPVNNLISLFTINLIPIALISLPTYILLRIIGG